MTMRRLAARDVAAIRLFDGAASALEALATGGARVAIVSSNAEANVRQVVGADLAARVSDFACGAAVFGKPARFKALRRLHGLEPGRVLAVGDELRDLEAARAAGIAAGAVSWGFATPAALAAGGPDYLFESFDRIPAAVLG